MGPSDAVYKRNRAQSREQIMRRGTPRRSAIVADRRPLERGLARFLLEERGLIVVGEAATMADVLLQVQQLRPDVIILHEKLALDHDPTVIAQIRRTSPRTSIVLLAANRESLPPELILLADTVVEDGPGLTELGAAVAGPSGARPATAHAEAAGVQAPPIASPRASPAACRMWRSRASCCLAPAARAPRWPTRRSGSESSG